MRSKVTVQQIADLAGVSKFAVSRALSGKSGVSNQTREMILKTAGQLGYFKNNPAYYANEAQDNDSNVESGTIVILFPNIRYQNHDSAYWGPIFDGISARLNQKGLDIITLTEPSGERVFSLLNPKAIQGIITLGEISTQILLEIKRLDIPVVMVDHIDPAYHCDTVFVDNFACMRELMMKLISKGYKDFQFVGNIHYAPSFYERWIAYRSVLDEYQIESKQHPLLIGPDAGEDLYKIAVQILDEVKPDVFVCANDTNAMYLIQVLKEKGIDVPGRCAVSGFDNTHGPDSNFDVQPPITTVDVNKEQLGRRAVDKLLWRISNRLANIEKTLIYGEIIIRESTR
jgi:LacI family transcriptional regulator